MPEEENPFKGKRGLRRVWNAFHYSMDGLRSAYRSEEAFRQEVWLAVILIPSSFFMPVNGIERAVMIASVIIVLIMELINSGIEAVVDRISPEKHPLSKRAKDVGSAAVLLALINVAAVWGLILFG